MSDAAQQVREILTKIEKLVDDLESAINTTLSLVPDIVGYIVDRVREAWDGLMKKLGEFWNWFVDKLSYVGNADILRSTATSWRTEVGAVANNLVRDIDDLAISADDTWKGFGAEQYRQSIPPQRDALKSLHGEFTTNIAKGLEDLASAINVFWRTVAGSLIGVTVAFGVATGEAVTVFGIPLAPPTALGGIAVALGAIALAYTNLSNAAASASSSFEGAAAGITTWPEFRTA